MSPGSAQADTQKDGRILVNNKEIYVQAALLQLA